MQRPSDEIYQLRASFGRWPAGKPLAGRLFSRDVPVETDVDEPSLAYWRATGVPSRTAIIICPGGGYEVLAAEHEGANVAAWLSAAGIAAFVLRYRVPGPGAPAPLEDAHAAMRFVRELSELFGVDDDRVGLLGFSAGGHLAGSAGLLSDKKEEQPDFLAMIYPVVTMTAAWGHAGSARTLIGGSPDLSIAELYSLERQVRKGAPPLFLVHARDDELVPIENSLALQAAYGSVEAECDAHFYAAGGHGFGLGGKGTEVADWPDRLAAWLRARALIPAESYEKLSHR